MHMCTWMLYDSAHELVLTDLDIARSSKKASLDIIISPLTTEYSSRSHLGCLELLIHPGHVPSICGITYVVSCCGYSMTVRGL